MTVLLVNDTIGRVAGSNQACQRISRKLSSAGEHVVWTGTAEATVDLEEVERETGAKLEPLGAAARSRLSALGRAVVSPTLVGRFERLLKRTKPDWALVCNVHNALSPAVIGVLAAHRIPVVFFPFDNWLWCVRKYNHVDGASEPCRACVGGPARDVVRLRCGGSLASSLWHYGVRKGLAQRRLLARGVRGWVVPTEVYGRALSACGVPESRMLRLSFPLDEVMEEPLPLGQRFVYYGAVHPAKGLQQLFAALEGMRDFPLDMYLTEPLEGELAVSLARAARDNAIKVDADLRWTTGLRERVRAARGVVVPSAWDSVGEQTLFEAMTFGRPVIASDIEVHRRWLPRPEQGALAPLGDADAFRRGLMEATQRFASGAGAVAESIRAIAASQERWAERLTNFVDSIA